MANLLVIESSPRSASVSGSVAKEYVTEWQRKHPTGKVVRRNVATSPAPFVTEQWIAAAYTPVENRTKEQKQILAVSETLIDELEAADAVVLAVPMHNFGVSAQLKAWIDQVVRVGRTFSYTAQGPQGLLDENKKVVVIVARGGAYSGESPYAFLDQQEPYLRTVLGFIGLKNVQFVYAENQARGTEAAEQGIKAGISAALALA
ncbi:FMN-dependent NADH-azoreductase [Alloacidobacterium sp.]|uniref:FMN-dependent NADH-azoreductase n=1 Tax=Alloacidobacterium sp. TaxID=2951999 RepID=UPI002D3B68D5|nr:NAD(P)H-dependent oxidoreductase [Alloacidobacterium sp.]HYK36924.1 NAD(P)H-dependent oxidoreductase [Alloacidobacterium sp.]